MIISILRCNMLPESTGGIFIIFLKGELIKLVALCTALNSDWSCEVYQQV
jgi:hypothetical protein